jgi:hypothetical protein
LGETEFVSLVADAWIIVDSTNTNSH